MAGDRKAIHIMNNSIILEENALRRCCCDGQNIPCFYHCDPCPEDEFCPEGDDNIYVFCEQVTTGDEIFGYNLACYQVDDSVKYDELPGGGVVVEIGSTYEDCEECCTDQPLDSCPDYDSDIHPDSITLALSGITFNYTGVFDCYGIPPCDCFDETFAASVSLAAGTMERNSGDSTTYGYQCVEGALTPSGDYGFYCKKPNDCTANNRARGYVRCSTYPDGTAHWYAEIFFKPCWPDCYNGQGDCSNYNNIIVDYKRQASVEKPGPRGVYEMTSWSEYIVRGNATNLVGGTLEIT